MIFSFDKLKGPRGAILVLLALLVVLGLLTMIPAGISSGTVVVSIPMGSGTGKVAHDLKECGLIRSEFLFKAAVLLSGSRGKLKAGEYEILRRSNLWSVVGVLRSGKSLLHEFTVPEGLSAFQIARVLGEKKLADPKKFLNLVQDAGLAKQLGVPAHSLEGFLFPDTYQIPRNLGEEKIARLMVERFFHKVDAALLAKGKSRGLKPLQVVVLASIVEREARADAERAKVASVFLNRIGKNMRLESCATVRFAMDKYQGPVLSEDLHYKSPYNTYRHRGLPPGPICSPGLKSLQAAAEPAKTDYLFFVVAGNGEHIFSKDFESHKKAKFRYKAKKRAGVEEE
jgi:UPF0755 protein